MTDTDEADFKTPEEEVRHWRSKWEEAQDALRETEATMQDFVESSKELEQEMEREIEASNRRLNDLQSKNEAIRGEVDDWRGKYQKLLAEHNDTLKELQRELSMLRESHTAYKNKLRDMELNNDELENAERMVASSLQDMEGRYNKAIERTALLEEELAEKARLEEENQRLRDEMRDLNEELAIMRETVRPGSALQVRASSPTASADPQPGDMTIAELTMSNHNKFASGSAVGAASSALRKELSHPPRPMSAQLVSTPAAVRRMSSVREPITPRFANAAAHARRGSRDIRQELSIATGSMQGDEGSPVNLRRMSAHPTVGGHTRESLASPRTVTRTATYRRAGANGAGSTAPAGQQSSMKIMQDMMARMKVLSDRINQARDGTRVAPRATDTPTDRERSAIPRPASRLGASIGPGAGAGYISPISASSQAFPNTPVASLSQVIRTPGGPRPSFDGKASLSSIPLPSNGLSRSVNRGRPSSRLSHAPSLGGEASPTPPVPTMPLSFRSVTPVDTSDPLEGPSAAGGNRPASSASSSSHNKYDWMHEDPAGGAVRSSHASTSSTATSIGASSSTSTATDITPSSTPSASAAARRRTSVGNALHSGSGVGPRMRTISTSNGLPPPVTPKTSSGSTMEERAKLRMSGIRPGHSATRMASNPTGAGAAGAKGAATTMLTPGGSGGGTMSSRAERREKERLEALLSLASEQGEEVGGAATAAGSETKSAGASGSGGPPSSWKSGTAGGGSSTPSTSNSAAAAAAASRARRAEREKLRQTISGGDA